MLEDFNLKGKVALVTGGSRGLGYAAAKALLLSNAEVIITGRNKETLEKAADELMKVKGKVTPYICDVTNSEQIYRVKEKILEQFGRVDILVNNAGIVIEKMFSETSDEEIEQIMATNLIGVMKVSRIIGEIMVNQKKGKIINIGSYDGLVGTPRLVAYGTSKGAVIQFTRMLAIEWARYKVNVNVICPGYFRTSMNEEIFDNEELTDKIIKRIPLRRIGEANELGPLIVYLSSEGSAYMTGQALTIDGGETAH
ncbi:SDR family NAD(P)-dependent oxidoreductase [Planococcus salinus]|uniref:Glucose 1-dehydrogenase n=1 Tax=Planococcus salinus TaxID=1848460 RepID=A0A3M8P989_9BACL|nr:glucose 1-dehydrogenase [Planococcus salinus]RNF40238.1 glucose 1-dehydrogenase [Planococcus salinus]